MDYEEFSIPPTTLLVATVKGLTGVLDYASKEVEDMDYAAYDPAHVNTGRWTGTSTM